MVRPQVPADLESVIRLALAEDLGRGDLTSALIPDQAHSSASVLCREDAVLAGVPWFEAVFRQLDAHASIAWEAAEGDAVKPNSTLCRIEGSSRALLTAERTALNFLQTLSATATVTRTYVDAVRGTRAVILDTRKTLPCLRTAQKYAVVVGGGQNHRMGLYDQILIKENHIQAAGSITAAVRTARQQSPGIKVEVEVEGFDELAQALAAGADVIMLDDFADDDLIRAVSLCAGRSKLEVSGGVDLSRVRRIAETGVDYISVGALTKHIRAIDLSLRFL